ncbi:hypothetical protein H2198_004504 [Neophaeococcomyces mojaviensis]|uniref:Uncharacterized protein n=1 Tax=Neophaeococcomyces mojaviensis TaxID=3383035 RepID=A0ACC3A8C3_9EURO|nr:hypothetical protein H2198_004504 [Knufia sp. JES_112]
MAPDAEEWPPRSPLKALLSSPSGRRKFHELQSSSQASTSTNNLLGSPSLLEKLRAARADQDHLVLPQAQDHKNEDEDGDEEDEETLQLKLQAIEAKLKLRKLQQQRAKRAEGGRTQSPSTSVVQSDVSSSRLEVALSPTKRGIAVGSKSPSRVRLGIDKGLTAADISLKRARTVNGSPTKPRTHTTIHDASRVSRVSTPTSARPSTTSSTSVAKSFSERVVEMRDKERDREQKSSALRSARSSNFKFDKRELESYHAAAKHATANSKDSGSQGRSRLTSPTRKVADSTSATSSDRENDVNGKSHALKHSGSLPSLRATSPSKSSRPSSSHGVDDMSGKGDASLYEPFSNTHLSSRILPHTFLKRTISPDNYTHLTVPKLLKYVTSPSYSLPEHITDYVIFGIIASKSSPLDHKARKADTNSVTTADWEKKWDTGTANRQKFMVMQLTDLKWTVDLYLFGSAVPRYHRLSQGTVIAVLNPAIMPPKKGQEDTGKFSLTLHDGEDQVLEIGTAKHLGYCAAKKHDSSECRDWVDASKTSICEYHVNAELEKTRSKRMGINSMTGFGKKGEKTKTVRKGWDYESGAYFVVGGRAPANKENNRPASYAPVYNKNLSTAHLLDATNLNDPFIAEGQMLERDKSDRLRRQMAAQEKEREIIKKLGQLGSGGAGGEYMRHRAGDTGSGTSTSRRADAVASTKAAVMAEKPGETVSKKRTADSVRLSPVRKKTRFVTEKGIREAGRESIGALDVGKRSTYNTGQSRIHDMDHDDDEDDDDDLDIV